MLPPVYATLRLSPDVVSILGTRIYRHGFAPQDTDRPYLTWFLVVGTPENTLSERPTKDRQTIQMDIYCGGPTGDTDVETAATAVRDALELVCHLTGQPVDGREPDTKLWRQALQFDWFVDRVLAN